MTNDPVLIAYAVKRSASNTLIWPRIVLLERDLDDDDRILGEMRRVENTDEAR
jgi:hypothetical protein